MIRPGIVYFTPSMNDPALLEAIFTARHDLALHLMSRIRDSAESGSRHYSLVTGPRGVGKTHLVSLINHRVKQDAALHEKLRIAWLQEDPWAVSSYARLLRATLSQLNADYRVPGWATCISAIEDLAGASQIESALENLLVGFLEDRVLLLIAENFDDILDGLGDGGQKKLRAFLQTKGVTTILATSTSLLPDLEDRNGPFYGTFKKYALEPFSFDDCVEVLLRIAQYRADAGLEEMLRSPQGRARVRAIHHIAGGNPRIYVIFYQFLSRESLDQLSEPFLHLVEELTPYYQARMQTLSPQQRTLVDIIRRHESPIAVRDIARTAFISSQSASSDLKLLRDLGYVNATQVGRESLYELREPLMRICLAAKEQRGQSLPLFVEFLRIWFTPSELRGWGLEMAHRAPDYDRYREAIDESRRRHDALASWEHEQVKACKREGKEDLAVARLIAWTDHETDDSWAWSELVWLLEKRKDFDKLILAATNRVTLIGDASSWAWLEYAYRLAGDFERALGASTNAVALAPNNPAFRQNHLLNLSALKRHADLAEAARTALEIPKDENNAVYWNLRAECLAILNRTEEASRARLKSLAIDHVHTWRSLGGALDALGARQSRLRASEVALSLFPRDALAWLDYSTSLWYLARYQESLDALDKAIALAPDEKGLLGERLCCLFALNDVEGASAALEHFEAWRKLRTFAYQYAWRAILMLSLGEIDEARRALEAYIDQSRTDNALGEIGEPNIVAVQAKGPAAWMPHIRLWLEVFQDRGELGSLGAALVRGPLRNSLRMPPALARSWFEAWAKAASEIPELALPLRLMEAGVRFMETEDRSVLLELPVEQRSLLEPEIERYLWASGKIRREIDDEVDAFLDTIRPDLESPVAQPLADAQLAGLLSRYDSRRRPAASLRPLKVGRWSGVPKEEAHALLRMLADGSPSAASALSRPGLSVKRVDKGSFSFVKGHIYQAHIDVNGRIGAIDFWSDGATAELIDGSNGAPTLGGSTADGAAFLTFSFSVWRSGPSRFEIFDPDDTALIRAVRLKDPGIKLLPLSATEYEGKPAYTGHMVYDDDLYLAVVALNREKGGTVEMLKADRILDSLGLPRETFDGPIRFRAVEEEQQAPR